MTQPIQNTDAYLLMQIARDLEPFKRQPLTPAVQKQMSDAARPHAQALLKNGHSQEETVSLVGAVWSSMR